MVNQWIVKSCDMTNLWERKVKRRTNFELNACKNDHYNKAIGYIVSGKVSLNGGWRRKKHAERSEIKKKRSTLMDRKGGVPISIDELITKNTPTIIFMRSFQNKYIRRIVSSNRPRYSRQQWPVSLLFPIPSFRCFWLWFSSLKCCHYR